MLNIGEIAFCGQEGVLKASRVLGYAMMIIKIVVPVIIIITAIIAFSRAVIEDNTNQAISSLLQKIVVGVLIFFIPSIMYAVMSLTNGYDKTKSQFTNCGVCFSKPTGSKCKGLINSAPKLGS